MFVLEFLESDWRRALGELRRRKTGERRAPVCTGSFGVSVRKTSLEKYPRGRSALLRRQALSTSQTRRFRVCSLCHRQGRALSGLENQTVGGIAAASLPGRASTGRQSAAEASCRRRGSVATVVHYAGAAVPERQKQRIAEKPEVSHKRGMPSA